MSLNFIACLKDIKLQFPKNTTCGMEMEMLDFMYQEVLNTK